METKGHLPMNAKTIHSREMFGRVSRSFADHPTVTLGAHSIAQVAVVNSSITAMDSFSVDQVAGQGESIGGTSARDGLATTLRDRLRDMELTAESFDPVLFPDAADVFQLPRSQSYAVLLATAGAFLEAMPTYKDVFCCTGIPGDLRRRTHDAGGRLCGRDRSADGRPATSR